MSLLCCKQSLAAVFLCIVGVYFAGAVTTSAQDQTDARVQATSTPPEHTQVEPVSSLQDLLDEAERNNPQIAAARQGWQAAKQVPSQVSALPDPQFEVQQVNVGSPRPFAGYTNSDFAYFGLGVSQDIPYPGKLRLRGQIAEKDANVAQQRYESVRRSVLASVKSAYFHLAYLAQTLRILESDGQLLGETEKAADARYRSGAGTQQDLLQAQLEQTKLVREITMHHLDVAKSQAQLKELLNRPQTSPDIETADLPETALAQTFEQLLDTAKTQNPEIAGAEQGIAREKLKVDLAHKDFYPDFSVQYMWQRTDPAQYRAYYMLSIGVQVPIYKSRKQQPELAQAEAELSESQSEAESDRQQVAFQLRTAFDAAEKDAELMKIDNDGLLPQARTEFQSGLASYQNDREEFSALLTSFRDVLNLDEEYWQTLADRETAIAEMEELTGLSLEGQEANQ